MSYDEYYLIEMALKSVGLEGQYFQKFTDNRIDDDLLKECLLDKQHLSDLINGIMPAVGDRIRFLKAFGMPATKNGSKMAPLTSSFEELHVKPSPHSEITKIITIDEPRPLQIMDFAQPKKQNGPSEVIFHQHVFKQILSKTKTEKVAIVSIAGPSRKGKSFFLNYVLRYLYGKKNNNKNWTQCDNLAERLSGFAWKPCTDRVTRGIWVWSEPFQMKSTNGDDFDVLIMDTQGVFDEHTAMREWSILVGLGLLVSSCLIFNVVGDIQEDGLLVFEKFLDFGLIALNEDETTTPFQNLLFLVRDWNVPIDFSYGFIGGRKYLKTKLDAKGSHKESHQKVRQQLKDCFEDISCCLLPHPGEEFLSQNVGGFISKEDDKFLIEIGRCISEIMDPANIPAKKINGNHVSGADILQTFSKYCDFFNSDDTLSPDSIFQTMSKHSNDLVIKNCLEHFKKEINVHLSSRPFVLQDDLFEIKETAMHTCLQTFATLRKIGDKNLLKTELVRQVGETYQIIKEKNDQNRQIVTSKAFDSAQTEYEMTVSRGMKEGYLCSRAMDSLLVESATKVSLSYASSCGIQHIDLIPKEAEKFHQFIKSKNRDFENENALKKLKAEKMLNDEIQNLVDVYASNMEDRTHGLLLSKKQLEELHEKSRKQSFDGFNALKANKELIYEAEKNLNKKIVERYDRISKDVWIFNEKINVEGKALITEAVSIYVNCAKEKITANEEDFDQVQKDLLKLAQKIIADSCPVEDAQFLAKLCCQLKDEIATRNQELDDIFQRNKKDIMMQLGNAIDDAVNMYKHSLNKLLPKNDLNPVEPVTLEETHTRAMHESTEWLEATFQHLCVTCKGIDENVLKNFNVEFEIRVKDEYNSIKDAKAGEVFTNAKESYVKRMKEVETSLMTNEDNLRLVQSEIKKDLTENLEQQLRALLLSSEKLEIFLKDFDSFIEIEFETTLDIWRMTMLEDELTVKTAFLDVKEFYKDEMEKHFQSKDFFSDSELQNIHKIVMEAAVERGRNEVDISERQELQLRKLIHNLFMRYNDQNLLRMPTDDNAIGIDLGTTFSCVAVSIKGKVTVISQNESTTIPSYVAFKENRSVDVGEAAKEQSFRRPEATIFDAKRLIGRKFSDKIVQDDMKLWPFEVVNDSDDQPKIKIPGHSVTYFPEEISARVLTHMKKMAEEFLNQKISNAVVTVPAYFSESQRHATKDAARIAGLYAKILDEPTAAAISYELHRTDDYLRNVLIFDLGGGTFDVAVLIMNGGEIAVKAKNGDTHLGGEDFDNEVVKHIIKIVKEKHKIDLSRDNDSSDQKLRFDASVRLRRIRSACEKQKRILSTSDSVVITIPQIDRNFDLEETFTRAQFEDLNLSNFKKCIDITAEVISDAGMVKSDIDDIVLIGGSTRIPKIRELLTKFFDGKALNKRINADEAVAVGAAIQAALLFGKRDEVNKNIKVKDVTPMSLGVHVVDGSLRTIIRKNTPIPCNEQHSFYTVYEGQTVALIEVFEGENRIAVMNNKLGAFEICDIPKAPARKEPIDVCMAIDDEGILHVEAVCRSTGKSEGITIVEHKGRMSIQQIEMAQLGIDGSIW